MIVYLGGPINGCTDEEANGWRDEVKAVLDAKGIEWIDPMDRDYRGRELEPGVAEEIVENDKLDIRASDTMLMNCPKPSVGTSMEILFGYEIGNEVLIVVPEGTTPSPWLLYHGVVLYGSVVEVAKGLT
jgi:nucleoside 2-deoxyribosyltransferase